MLNSICSFDYLETLAKRLAELSPSRGRSAIPAFAAFRIKNEPRIITCIYATKSPQLSAANFRGRDTKGGVLVRNKLRLFARDV